MSDFQLACFSLGSGDGILNSMSYIGVLSSSCVVIFFCFPFFIIFVFGSSLHPTRDRTEVPLNCHSSPAYTPPAPCGLCCLLLLLSSSFAVFFFCCILLLLSSSLVVFFFSCLLLLVSSSFFLFSCLLLLLSSFFGNTKIPLRNRK